ncbi:TonB-dependent receptor [Aliifodinibius sp. S!AR15-10]|uniref:TonB-dependent receptor n=1 Tax=Aliifodinibius sp. S!AR15-10 TaxID=2950437 RepID=UPI0028653866|nr:TonB-dependent receptor [Aliifodinibius sp. S!AR15-10]MDR8390552.1 TonB-dependent receptor [Aliifodinibius sp. S!AR15-10]
MNRLYKLTFVIFWLSCFTNLLQAQDGTIRGTVIEDASGEPLYGVTVLLVGESKGTTTDFDGKFDLEVSAGTYDIRISYVSYRAVTIEEVEVTEGEVTNFDNIRLQKSVEEMEEVVVTADLVNISEAALMTQKKKSANLVDGISAERFRRVGDSNAAGALKRVTGVSVEGGKYVYVRGLGDRYTKTMLNSVDIPSLDPNRNSLQIDIFPTNLINNMVITKTAVAEMPADFTGGIVNIETKDFPGEPIFDVSASIDYNPSMHFNNNYLTYEGSDTDFLGFDNGARELPNGADAENIPTPISGASEEQANNFVNSFNPTLGPRTDSNMMDYSLGLSLGDQFNLGGGNTLGYIFSGTYKTSSTHYDDFRYGEYQIPEGPDNYELIYATRQNGTVSEKNVLVGGLAGLAFKTERSKYRLTGMHLQNGESRSSNFAIDNSESTPGQSGYIGDSYNLEYGERGITNFLLNGVHYFNDTKWEVNWRVSPTFSKMVDPDIRRTTYTIRESNNEPIFNAGAGGFPSRLWRYLDEMNLVGRLDISREYELFGEPARFKFGGSHVYKQRDYEILSYSMAFFGSTPELEGNPEEILKQGNIYPDGTIYYQSGNQTPNPNAYSSNVHNTAFYLSNEFNPIPNLKASIGVRAEQYVQRHTGRDALYAQGSEAGNNLDDEKVLDALDFFPSANLTYFLNDNQNLRFSYSRTIARPSFKELSFAQILDPVSDRIFNGGLFPIGEWDGNLGETRIHNLDLRWERFSNNGQILSVSGFYKSFDDPIELVRIRTQVTSTEYQPRNVGKGEVYGAEFELRQSLDFLSPSLDNFGFNTNVTLVQSSIEMTEEEYEARKRVEKDGQVVDDTRQMAGQSPYIINAGLTYENPEISFDAGFFYNLKGETLTIVGGGVFPDVYSEPFHSLNFNLNKSFGRASLSLKVTNILNQVQEETFHGYQAEEQLYEQYNPHTSASLGFKYSF